MNSSLKTTSLREFIQTSLEILHLEFPQSYYLMCLRLSPRKILLQIDGEPIYLVFSPGGVKLNRKEMSTTNARLITSRGTILDVLDARLTLEEAVQTNAIQLQGHVDDLTAFHDGLLMYVRGAVRCPSFPPLLERFRHTSPTSAYET